MERTEEIWGLAQRTARDFLRRFEDRTTRNARDDLVQEAALAAWRWVDRAEDTSRLPAAVRTIARRARCRLFEQARRRDRAVALLRQEEDGAPATYVVAGHQVSRRWLLGCLHEVLGRLPETDRRLLLGRHEGFCCQELALRSSHSEGNVKVRIHRTRRRVQSEIERLVRAADRLDGEFAKDESETTRKPRRTR